LTKLWNIGRFLLSNVGIDPVTSMAELDASRLARADRWILARLNSAIEDCNAALGPARPRGGVWTEAEYRAGLHLSEYVESARRFVWNELADWYVEAVKMRVASTGDDREVARAVLVHVFSAALRLLHPVVPFITEALWRRLPSTDQVGSEFVATAAWPVTDTSLGEGREFELVREAIV